MTTNELWTGVNMATDEPTKPSRTAAARKEFRFEPPSEWPTARCSRQGRARIAADRPIESNARRAVSTAPRRHSTLGAHLKAGSVSALPETAAPQRHQGQPTLFQIKTHFSQLDRRFITIDPPAVGRPSALSKWEANSELK